MSYRYTYNWGCREVNLLITGRGFVDAFMLKVSLDSIHVENVTYVPKLSEMYGFSSLTNDDGFRNILLDTILDDPLDSTDFKKLILAEIIDKGELISSDLRAFLYFVWGPLFTIDQLRSVVKYYKKYSKDSLSKFIGLLIAGSVNNAFINKRMCYRDKLNEPTILDCIYSGYAVYAIKNPETEDTYTVIDSLHETVGDYSESNIIMETGGFQGPAFISDEHCLALLSIIALKGYNLKDSKMQRKLHLVCYIIIINYCELNTMLEIVDRVVIESEYQELFLSLIREVKRNQY